MTGGAGDRDWQRTDRRHLIDHDQQRSVLNEFVEQRLQLGSVLGSGASRSRMPSTKKVTEPFPTWLSRAAGRSCPVPGPRALTSAAYSSTVNVVPSAKSVSSRDPACGTAPAPSTLRCSDLQTCDCNLHLKSALYPAELDLLVDWYFRSAYPKHVAGLMKSQG